MSRAGPRTADRLSAYTDAVFAVIVTIMVLELRPPSSPEFGALLELWPTFVSYIVSYGFIAIIWTNHHHLMSYVSVPSLRVIWFNFGHLFFVSLLPFVTAWVARTVLGRDPVIVYAALFVLIDAMYNLFEMEILRNSPEVSSTEYRALRRRSLFALALFVVATALAFGAPWLGFGCICLALVLHLIPGRPLRPVRPGRSASSKDR